MDLHLKTVLEQRAHHRSPHNAVGGTVLSFGGDRIVLVSDPLRSAGKGRSRRVAAQMIGCILDVGGANQVESRKAAGSQASGTESRSDTTSFLTRGRCKILGLAGLDGGNL